MPEPLFSDSSDSGAALGLKSQMPGLSLISSDRAKLDVMVSESTELFSWPDESRFNTNSPEDLLGGGFSGNGDFADFVLTVFSADHVTFEDLGTCGGASCVRFAYDVPVAVSRYIVKTPISQGSLGFHGTFDVDPQSDNLLTMTVIPTDLPQELRVACGLRTRMKYARAILSASEFTIPESSDKEYFSDDGWYFSNRIRYTGCRQYTAESALTFGDETSSLNGNDHSKAEPALPRPGTKLELRLASRIDSTLSWGGDPVEAILVRSVRGTDGRPIPAGTVVRGHLARVERTYAPRPGVSVAMRFDAIILDGAPVGLNLIPVGKQDVRGRAVFNFRQEKVILDDKFVSQWRVRSP